MPDPHKPLTDEEIAVAAKIAAADQEMAVWIYDAECMAAFYRVLIEGEIPEPVANVMLLNAQINYYEDGGPFLNGQADDDDDDD